VKSKSWATVGAVAALAVGGVATPAMAASDLGLITPQGVCGAGDYNYEAVADSYTFTRASGNNSVVTGDPGVTLSISKTTTFTVGGTLGGTSSISASVVVATIQQQLNYSITASLSGTTTDSGTWTVPSDYTNGGRLEIGARTHSGAVQKYAAKPADCSNGRLVSATNYNAPEAGWYFKQTKL
jgi:hypothetical protein